MMDTLSRVERSVTQLLWMAGVSVVLAAVIFGILLGCLP
jgi:hypothetical protein